MRKTNAVHAFDDITAVRGFDYYYYIQSKDDGTRMKWKPVVHYTAACF